jgi:hypothetical protein
MSASSLVVVLNATRLTSGPRSADRRTPLPRAGEATG